MRAIQTTYRYQLLPMPEQQALFVRFAGSRRWLWNYALSRKREHYRAMSKRLTYNALAAELTHLKQQPQTAWLREVDSQLLLRALRDLETAFANFFAKRARYPKFRSKKRDALRFRIPQRVAVEGQAVRVPKIGLVRVCIHRPLTGTPKSATFKQEADGAWFVAIVVEQEIAERSGRAPQTHVGIDVGLKSFAVLSNGEQVANPCFFRVSERKLARAQRALSRKQVGSNNRQKAKARVARLHTRIRRQRGDFLHKLTTSLVKRFELISLEDLSVRGLAKSKLAKSVHDAAWSQFRTLLTYKADRVDGYVQLIGRFYPSSRLCSVCRAKNDTLTLSQREWTCNECGTLNARDANASINIDREGLRLFELSVALLDTARPETLVEHP